MEDHIHLIVRVSSREQFANALRMLAGTIARRIKRRGRLWRARAWSRVVTQGRDLARAIHYVAANPFRAGIWTDLDSFYIVDGILQV
jgi:REP element-mobilizing transposase RayT